MIIEGRGMYYAEAAQAYPSSIRSICLTVIALIVLIGLASTDLGDHAIRTDEDHRRESARLNAQVEPPSTVIDDGDTEGPVAAAEPDVQSLVNQRKGTSSQMNELQSED